MRSCIQNEGWVIGENTLCFIQGTTVFAAMKHSSIPAQQQRLHRMILKNWRLQAYVATFGKVSHPYQFLSCLYSNVLQTNLITEANTKSMNPD